MCLLIVQSRPILCDPMDCSPPGSSVHGIFQAGILQWVAMPFSRGSFQPRDRTWVSWIAGRFSYCLSHQGWSKSALEGGSRDVITEIDHTPTAHLHHAAAAKSLQSCPTLCDPIDGSPPGSPVPGILQTRTLEWVAISFSNAWKWKVKVKLLSRVRLLAIPLLRHIFILSMPGAISPP